MKVCKKLFLSMLMFLLFQSGIMPFQFNVEIRGVTAQSVGRRLYVWMNPVSEQLGKYTPQQFVNDYFLSPPYYGALELQHSWIGDINDFRDWTRDMAIIAQNYPAIEIMITVAFGDNADEWTDFETYLDTLQGITSIHSVGLDAEHWGWMGVPETKRWSDMTLTEQRTIMNKMKTEVEARGFDFVSTYFGANSELSYLEIGQTNYPCPPDPEFVLDWDVSQYHVGQDAGLYENHNADGSPHFDEDKIRIIIEHGLGIIGENRDLKDGVRRHFIGLCPGFFGGEPAWRTDTFRQWVVNQQAPYLGTGPNQILIATGEAPPPPEQFTLSVTTTVGGTTNPSPSTRIYNAGTVVTVTALPDTGYFLDRWELDGVYAEASNTITVTMDSDHTLRAVFALSSVPTATIKGTVTDAETGDPIVGASVSANAYSTMTGSAGAYSLIIPTGVYTLTVSGAGYEAYTQSVDASVEGTYTVDVSLTPSPPPPPYPENNALSLTNPSIGTQGCLATKQPYVFQVSVSDPNGVTNLKYVDLTLDPFGEEIKVRWTESAGSWSEKNDPNDYVYLGECSRSISGKQVTLNFVIMFRWTYPDENLHSVRVYSLNDNDLIDIDDFNNIYYVENDLTIEKSSLSDYRVNPSQTITISGYIYYEGTSILPPDGDYQVKVKLSGIQEGLLGPTLISGHYSIDFTAESTVGSYVYQVSCDYNASAVNTPPVIVSRLKVILKGATQEKVNVGATTYVYFQIVRECDNATFDGTKGLVYINGTMATWDDVNKYWKLGVSQVSVTKGTYLISSVVDNEFGISVVNDVVGGQEVVWDELTVSNVIMAIHVKDSITNTALEGASVYIRNDTWTSETTYTNMKGWANFTRIKTGTYAIVGEAEEYAVTLDTVSVTTDISYTLLLSKPTSPPAVTPILSPELALILIVTSILVAIGYFIARRRSGRKQQSINWHPPPKVYCYGYSFSFYNYLRYHVEAYVLERISLSLKKFFINR